MNLFKFYFFNKKLHLRKTEAIRLVRFQMIRRFVYLGTDPNRIATEGSGEASLGRPYYVVKFDLVKLKKPFYIYIKK